MATSKVDKWAAMAVEKQAATVTLRLSNLKAAGSLAIHDLTTATLSETNLSSHKDLSVAIELTVAPTTTLIQKTKLVTFAAYEEPITPALKQHQPRLRKRAKRRGITHDRETAHLFNNAGLLIPSIPGIDPVTERLFEKGEIMSLGQSCARDSYYQDGEPLGGSFLLGYSNEKKRKRDYYN